MIELRPITDSDMSFLTRVYAATRQAEMALTGWPQDQIDEFLEMQAKAQQTYYVENLQPAEFMVVEKDQTPIGRIYIGDWQSEIRIIDIALLPEHQYQGIGTQLIEDVMARARSTQRNVTLHVEQFNPAVRLYRRLGFEIIEERGINFFMEWRPDD